MAGFLAYRFWGLEFYYGKYLGNKFLYDITYPKMSQCTESSCYSDAAKVAYSENLREEQRWEWRQKCCLKDTACLDTAFHVVDIHLMPSLCIGERHL